MELKDLIQHRRNSLGLTYDEIGDACGVAKTTVRKWELGLTESMKSDKILALAKILKVSPLDILGVPEEHAEPKEQQGINNLLNVYGKVCAGDGALAYQEIITQINNPYPRLKGDIFALQVIGDSMNNFVQDGDYAIVKKQSDVNSGDVAVVLIDGETAMIKTLTKIGDSVIILTPNSTNPKHKPIPFSGDELNTLRIIGRVVGYVGKYKE